MADGGPRPSRGLDSALAWLPPQLTSLPITCAGHSRRWMGTVRGPCSTKQGRIMDLQHSQIGPCLRKLSAHSEISGRVASYLHLTSTPIGSSTRHLPTRHLQVPGLASSVVSDKEPPSHLCFRVDLGAHQTDLTLASRARQPGPRPPNPRPRLAAYALKVVSKRSTTPQWVSCQRQSFLGSLTLSIIPPVRQLGPLSDILSRGSLVEAARHLAFQ